MFSQDQVAGPSGFCQIEPSAGGKGRDVVVSLTATTSPTEVAGYRLVTMSYNGSYLAPVVELAPGDTLKVRLLNSLVPLAGNAADGVSHDTMHDPADATNLHTHGLIVSPKNALNPTRGNGDNVFVSLKRGEWLDYSIRIPTELKSSILCKDEPPTPSCAGTMVHPNGLYWYHSHLHGISTAQVAGGMSGLLSIGPRDANLLANAPDAATQAQETSALSQTTDVFYLMLRDIELRSDTKPGATTGVTPAEWIPPNPRGDPQGSPCYPTPDSSPPVGGDGFCQSPREANRFWIFTVNGQRFPTVDIKANHRALLRVANLSANITYQLSFIPQGGGDPLKFKILSVDGIVPAEPKLVAATSAASSRTTPPVQLSVLTLMPAARAEILLDGGSGTYILTTCEQHTGAMNSNIAGIDRCKRLSPPYPRTGDHWPEMRLAKVIFEPSTVAAAQVALNAPSVTPALFVTSFQVHGEPPAGCAPDINPDRSKHQYRQVEFGGIPGAWTVTARILQSPKAPGDPPDIIDEIGPLAFEDYVKDGAVDWSRKHTCVRLANGHGQFWDLYNGTPQLHNFHIHQIKFRLARPEELREHGIDPASADVAFANAELASIREQDTRDVTTWHDTIPIPPIDHVYIVLNFDDQEQVGKFVFHCHILKHEDTGLMAPMEVIDY